ncbi:hypothetical protein J4732_07815 [Serratia marcescens]|uniref:Uncharacterized protein n=1 Tax=Serratia marcescens TaxID=615 RepID=A0A939NLQ8_SERMA|nr:hypothetical protein [Serratia marcescens]
MIQVIMRTIKLFLIERSIKIAYILLPLVKNLYYLVVELADFCEVINESDQKSVAVSGSPRSRRRFIHRRNGIIQALLYGDGRRLHSPVFQRPTRPEYGAARFSQFRG